MAEPRHILSDAPARGKIGKQIRLPFSKAVEIAVKSLRVRFWRSMLTVSSIILAIAFLTDVLASSRLQSAVAIGLKDGAPRLNALNRAVDEAWRPLEDELSKRFGTRRQEYKSCADQLYAGETARFKASLVLAAQDKTNPVRLAGLPCDNAVLASLAARLREAGLAPDLGGWPEPGLALAGIKGVMQAEADRVGRVQLALQREGLDPAAPVEKLRRISPTSWWLILISLTVCAVGITNAMLMSVTERFREIGTMKCLGALDSFIVKLFLLESTLQGVAGTGVGIVIGFVIMLASGLAAFGGSVFEFIPWLQMGLIAVYAVLIGAGLSIAGAILPALRAAQMAPVEAMRADE